MKRKAQPLLSEASQQTFDQYTHVLQDVEDLSAVTIRNYLSDLRQFMAWCEDGWCKRQNGQFFTPQAIAPAPSLLMRYREYLQNTLDLKPSTVNRTLMSLKRYLPGLEKRRWFSSTLPALSSSYPKRQLPLAI